MRDSYQDVASDGARETIYLSLLRDRARFWANGERSDHAQYDPHRLLCNALRAGVVGAGDVIGAAERTQSRRALMEMIVTKIGSRTEAVILRPLPTNRVEQAMPHKISAAIGQGVTSVPVLRTLYGNYESPACADRVLEHIACMRVSSDQGAPSAKARSEPLQRQV